MSDVKKKKKRKNRHSLKQVILVRKDLNMSPGKTAAQVAHASNRIILAKKRREGKKIILDLSPKEEGYYDSHMSKVVLSVKNERQLLESYQKAKDLGLPCSLIKDAGYTELEGQNFTTVAIGPADAETIDSITGKFRML